MQSRDTGTQAAGLPATGESVAGEEDPGAGNDVAASVTCPGLTGQPPPMAPGDEAPPGTPGTGEDLCPHCGGSGRTGAAACPVCEGTGRVVRAIGGA